MRKRKLATASNKRARRPKIAAKRAVQEIVRSPIPTSLRSAEAALPEMTDSMGINFSSATANVRAYQAKLLEIAQANTQFAFECAQRLATMRSPVDLPCRIHKQADWNVP